MTAEQVDTEASKLKTQIYILMQNCDKIPHIEISKQIKKHFATIYIELESIQFHARRM
jgi:hypothetical protein